jgi:hypothetical protein
MWTDFPDRLAYRFTDVRPLGYAGARDTRRPRWFESAQMLEGTWRCANQVTAEPLSLEEGSRPE